MHNEPAPASIVNPRTPPYSEEAERGVLGSILVDSVRVMELCSEKQLTGPSFFLRRHQLLFDYMRDMYADDLPIDLLTIIQRLRDRSTLEMAGGYEYLQELLDSTPTSAHAEYYVGIVHEKFLLRSVIEKASEAIERCYDPEKNAKDVVTEAEQEFYQINQGDAGEGEPWKETLSATMESAMHIFASGKPASGTPSGFLNIDAILNGLHPTDIIILAARPAMGKTSLAMNIAEHVALGYEGNMKYNPEGGKAVGIFSLEMGREQLAKRMLFSNAEVPMSTLNECRISAEQRQRLTDARDLLLTAQMYIDDTAGLEIPDLRSRARRMKRKYDIQFIMIDYLQLLNYSKYAKDGRQRETAAISGALKAMAKELHLPVLALSQLSRSNESRTDKSPQLSDLRDSGAIEQDADIVCMLYRPSYYDRDTEDDKLAVLNIAKHRSGSTGDVRLNFVREYTRFFDRTERYDEDEM